MAFYSGMRQSTEEVRLDSTLNEKTQYLVYWLGVYWLGGAPSQLENKESYVIQESGYLKGSQLSLETPSRINGMAVRISQILDLDGSGKTMTVDRMLLVHHG